MSVEYDDNHTTDCSLRFECFECYVEAGQPCREWCREPSVCTCPPVDNDDA